MASPILAFARTTALSAKPAVEIASCDIPAKIIARMLRLPGLEVYACTQHQTPFEPMGQPHTASEQTEDLAMPVHLLATRVPRHAALLATAADTPRNDNRGPLDWPRGAKSLEKVA